METEAAAVLSLRDIIKRDVRALIRRYHLSRDWIIGLIGERGSGKSLGGGNIAVRDFMMNGEPCWSNMQMKLRVNIDHAQPGGLVLYEAGHIEKQAFLRLDSRYEGGCLFFDEFNLEYGEARRSSANVNLMTDRAVQQLRKLQCGLIYTVLNEMYIDTRIRENTDLFIRCSDTAMKAGNLQGKMEQGVVFEWLLYPMTARVAGLGQTYADTKQPIGPISMSLKHLWGFIDTLERQAVGQTKYSETTPNALLPLDMQDDPAVIEDRDRWGWLDKRISHFYELHANDGPIIEISSSEFRQEMRVEAPIWGATVYQIKQRIKNIDQKGSGGAHSPTIYYIPNKELG